MKKIEVLCWGLKHISENHNCSSGTDWEEDGRVYVFSWDGINIPTQSDVDMLCDDLGIPKRFRYLGDYSYDICIPEDWDKDAEYKVTGFEMWKKYDAVIGQ